MTALLPVSTFRLGDCREVLAGLPDASIDSIVTDPPYELGFMGKTWDSSGIAYSVEMWAEALRVLKPGGHLLAFGGTRTYHRMVCAIEDAGFEIRDSIHWIYGSGFPKSLDVSKAIDRAEGPMITAPATPEAARWSGWSTALKPAHEPIVVARKPLSGTVAANVLAHGTGALNIDASRIAGENPSIARRRGATNHLDGQRAGAAAEHNAANRVVSRTSPERFAEERAGEALGRWPANILLAHDPDCIGATTCESYAPTSSDCESSDPTSRLTSTSPSTRPTTPGASAPTDSPDDATSNKACAPGCPVAEMDAQSGTLKSGSRKAGEHALMGYQGADVAPMPEVVGDSGGASRFFPSFRYQAKAPTKERPVGPDGTKHATVKPLALMRWLVRLVTPPGGTVLDPFAGSGTTLEAALLEGFDCYGIEAEITYVPLVLDRIARARAA